MKVKDNIADEFNAFSENYTEDMVKCVPYYLDLLNDFTTNLCASNSSHTILDLGCGNGNVTNVIKTLLPDAQYTLVDASEDMLNLCRQRFGKHNMNYVSTYFNDFNFEANTYTIITAGFSLHHCNESEKKELFASIHNALKKDGSFLCSDLMINKHGREHKLHLKHWEAFVMSNYSNSEKWSWLMDHYNQFDNPHSIDQHLLWLKNAGFEDFSFNIYGKYWTHFKAFKNNKLAVESGFIKKKLDENS